MDDLKYYLELIFKDEIEKVIISNPRLKSEAVRKITLEAKKGWLADCRIYRKAGVS